MKFFTRLIHRFIYGPLGKPIRVGIDGARLPTDGKKGPHAIWVQTLGPVVVDISANKPFTVTQEGKVLWLFPWSRTYTSVTNDQLRARAYIEQKRHMGVVVYTVNSDEAKLFAGFVIRPRGWRSRLPFPLKVGYQNRTPNA